MNNNFWSNIETLIADNELRKAVDLIINLSDISDDERMNMVSISSSLKGLTEEYEMTMISRKDYQIGKNRLTYRLLRVVKSLKSKYPNLELAEDSSSTKTSQPIGRTNSDQIRILFLGSSPDNYAPLKLGQEFREIDLSIKRSKFRDKFYLKSYWAVRSKDLQRALNDENPEILHFAGHGKDFKEKSKKGMKASFFLDAADMETGKKEVSVSLKDHHGGILLMTNDDSGKILRDELLAKVISMVGTVKCVILNACYSAVQAKEIIKHVDYVIGMNNAFEDDSAIEFARGFYDALGSGKDIEFAFENGKLAIELEGYTGAEIPVLHKKGED